ncbi:glycoside hydrolase family 127 protein [Ponticoccus sp. SC2-23]|uniref:glycoside hydrolase family 127 protein n=1 Tax=Alexandriicola marinus TaxID=2081710 RepID=UPI000FDBB830|nr:beta-L-arabinofuranosidase domain-containing protein [Alexandriicola marinus]MBM1220940.1 glycoside hydrolase family 127 protein [Ponticoccus sp. SC6-9]MBM1225510.1 glycoside hydrolase family 127 protein [Ponticoccus sp. SC6-15]MBM1227693.1 glycoside hydrolase family 127 protein [Ponticoccus sp. SC6-38]MBM1234669.1 glycoside hydrolase family 127 protein [Ponticoccus sp. SC6-45]MBM1238195.1 glycoside hydrolase family 127 protein [Ponticoccus sp. SC6-49]MBM1244172.1 glycoside hydrolase famil
MRSYQPVNFSEVEITGAFWRERLDCILTQTIPSQFRMLGQHGILNSLKLPRPVPPLTIPENRHGFSTQIFWDSDIGKWIEAASYALSFRRDAETEARIEAITDDLEAAQDADGYLNCWYLGREPENRWTNLRDNHELYCAGHMLEGAVAYFHATGRDRLLRIMERYVAHIATVFGPGEGQRRGYPGHQEIEIALIRLYHARGGTEHLDLARYFIDERGRQPHYFDAEARARGEAPSDFWAGTYEYNQSHLPVRDQTKVVGHAVRAMYMYAAMADLAAEDGDAALLSACETLWEDITTKRMYVTGGFGPSASNEGFTTDFDLPNDTAYAETCASVAMVFWAARMLNIDLDGRYGDILEQALFNNVLAGLSLDGERYFYDNKLESDGSHERWEWHPCPCCTMNVSRLLASIGGYVFSTGDRELAVHLYGGTRANVTLGGVPVGVDEVSGYPFDGAVRITISPETPVDFTLYLRVPGWAKGAALRINGVSVPLEVEKGYARLGRTWIAGDVVELTLPMHPERVYADPRVRQALGRVALRRGPVVYCIEDHDHDVSVAQMRLPRDADLQTEPHDALVPGMTAITAEAAVSRPPHSGMPLYSVEPPVTTPALMTAIPYYLWANRGPNRMSVWIRE